MSVMTATQARVAAGTGREVCRKAYETQPHLRLAIGTPLSGDPTCIGSWDKNLERFVPVAFVGIDGEWYRGPRYELLINGQPVERTWEEIPQ